MINNITPHMTDICPLNTLERARYRLKDREENSNENTWEMGVKG